MSRIRTIKPEFWGHSKVAKVSRDARLLFLGLLNESDDEGKLIGSPKRIAGIVFPYDDDVTAKKIEKWLTELAGVGLICQYSVDDSPYIFLPGFTEHQRISHATPSRLPNYSGMVPEPFVPDLGREGKGREADEEGKVGRKRRPTKDYQPTPEHHQFALKSGLDLDRERDAWLTWCEANGKTYARINAGFSTWLQNAVQFGRGKPSDNGFDPDVMSRRSTT